MVLPFAAGLIVGIKGSERGEEPSRGDILRLIQIGLATLSLPEITPASQANSPQARIPIPETQSTFHRHAQ
jgi:hypothetical protein